MRVQATPLLYTCPNQAAEVDRNKDMILYQVPSCEQQGLCLMEPPATVWDLKSLVPTVVDKCFTAPSVS